MTIKSAQTLVAEAYSEVKTINTEEALKLVKEIVIPEKSEFRCLKILLKFFVFIRSSSPITKMYFELNL